MPKRSPVIFWLLLAATVCVNVVATVWTQDDHVRTRSAVLYFGLAFGQLSVLTVWAILWPTKVGVRWLAPFVAAVPIAFVWTMVEGPHPDEAVFIFIGILSLHVTAAEVLMWLIKPTRLLARWKNVDASRRWQFSIGHLLVLMTCLAVFLVVLGRAVPGLSNDDIKNTLTMIIANVVLLLAVLVSIEQLTFWLFSLAASLGAAIVIAVACDSYSIGFSRELSLYPFNLIQAIVLWCWIAVLRPARGQTTSVAESPTPIAP